MQPNTTTAERELPTELLVKVLQSLELRELLRCRMVRVVPRTRDDVH